MKKQYVTQWFLYGTKPAHKGVYQRDYCIFGYQNGLGWFSYFDGEYWYDQGETPDEALLNFRLGIVSTDSITKYDRPYYLSWRGVAK